MPGILVWKERVVNSLVWWTVMILFRKKCLRKCTRKRWNMARKSYYVIWKRCTKGERLSEICRNLHNYRKKLNWKKTLVFLGKWLVLLVINYSKKNYLRIIDSRKRFILRTLS